MLAKTIFLAIALSAAGLAQEIDNNDVPNQCRAVCASMVSLAAQCDRQHPDNDAQELNCICSASGANTQLPLCEACVAQFDDDTDDENSSRDNDVNDLLRSCSFTRTSYNPSATATSVTNISGTPSLTTSGTPATTNAQSTGASQGNSQRPSTNAPTVTAGNAPVEQSTNAAPLPTLGAMGVGLGALGLALGMM